MKSTWLTQTLSLICVSLAHGQVLENSPHVDSSSLIANRVTADSTQYSDSASALATSIQIASEITSIQQDIANAEVEFGAFHLELLKPLQSMISLQVGLENYDEVDRLIDRYLHINRINQSPTNFGQLPLLVQQIANDIRRQQWQSINDRFQVMTWIFSRRTGFDTEDLLSLLDEFAAWNLAAVYIDAPEHRAEHFMVYRAVIENAVDFAEREYGADSEQLIPWLYREALMEYRGMTLRRTEDELRVGPGAGSSRAALAAIRRIRAIVERSDDPEALAMALVYEADFLRLANTLGRRRSNVSSDRLYREAAKMLVDIDRSEDRASKFFAQPTILPMDQFYFSTETAMLEQQSVDVMTLSDAEITEDGSEVLEFTAWNESLRFTRRPEKTSLIAGLSTELHSVQLRFSLGKRGEVRNFERITATPASGHSRAYARNAVEKLTFRPNPTAPRWRVERRPVNLLYRYTP